ncbi:hypothetical protein Pst134EB_031199 [Puccinia striiformis f. sp. tritici]|nr:hypothetical protein Pst134EB_031199 [Puccinia striiformis f. sp. tritici]
MDKSDVTSEPVEAQGERVRDQRQLVVEQYKNLRKGYGLGSFNLPDQASIQEAALALSIGGVDSAEVLLDQLHSCLLPLLRDQISTLLRSLDQESMLEDPGSNLEVIWELRSKLEHTLARIASVVVVVSPKPLPSSSRADDQHLQVFKSFRVHDLNMRMCRISHVIGNIFLVTCGHIENMNPTSTEESRSKLRGYESEDHHSSIYDIYDDDQTEEALNSIESIINCLNKSEADAAEEHWKPGLLMMDDLLYMAIRSSDVSSEWKSIRKPVLRLTEAVKPIIKLSRLFFAKLSKRGMNTKRLPPFSEMNSKQLKCLYESSQTIANDLHELWHLLFKADSAPEAVPTNTCDMTHKLETLSSHFEAPLLLVVIYLVPLTPETDPDHSYYRSWFATWNTQLMLAINHFQDVARSLCHIP